MKRLPRDVSVHLFRRTAEGPEFLMLRRCRLAAASGRASAGHRSEARPDTEAAVREVREETGFDATDSIFPLGVSYAYALRPDLSDHWEQIYGLAVDHVPLVTFAAELPEGDPTLDPLEHDAFSWCSYDQPHALLDWRIEKDALADRREALGVLNTRLRA